MAKKTRQVEYEDDRGRLYAVLLPAGVSDSEAESGIFVGPPDVVDELDLPEPFATRLHNELYRRKLHTTADLGGRSNPLLGALQKAFRVDQVSLVRAYLAADQADN
jgi:hypothetical protein